MQLVRYSLKQGQKNKLDDQDYEAIEEAIRQRYRREFDEKIAKENFTVITEGRARMQPMKDKIFLCNDDSDLLKEEMTVQEYERFNQPKKSYWRTKMLEKRDEEVRQIEEKEV